MSKIKKASKETQISPKEKTLENALHWMQMGVDFETRRIEINYEINEQSASFILRGLLKMCDLSSQPIEIYLSSPGGIVYDGLAIFDAIQACPCDVYIYASGKIMSSAFIVYLAGDKRLAAKNVTFMMHSISYQGEGKVKDQEIDVLEAKRLNNIFLDILASRTKEKKPWWYRQILSHDRYFNLEQAMQHGIVSPIEKKEKVNGRKPKRSKRTKVRQRKSSH